MSALTEAMTKGIVKNPEVYPNLTAASSFAEFQANLHSRSRGSCKMPCAPAVPAAAPAAKEARSADDEPPPAEPGCYLRTPSGCPNHPAKETTWRHDVVAEGRADLDDVGCTERKERWDDYCGTSDVRMVYVPAVALVVDGTKA
ncbi:unnamed protein product [Prorocentrum cordatum]|uniref:Uncharacterized protein n=1 Tax=Prorocentrum cordatum TaxID=2364126 RepID=A0ABN9TBV8_9DINO|nr:unnamed protein product [Polarella glacialis]